MSDRGLKVNSNAQMSHWAEIILSRQGEDEDDDSADDLINSQMYVESCRPEENKRISNDDKLSQMSDDLMSLAIDP